MAAAVAAGDVSAVDLTKAHLDRIEQTDLQVRAFLHVASDGALAAARMADERRAAGEPPGPRAGRPPARQGRFPRPLLPTTDAPKIPPGARPPATAPSPP